MRFTKYVKTESGTFQCSFIQAHADSGIKYYANVVDTHFRANLLTIELVKGRWRILDVHKVPRSILGIEAQLEEAILEQLDIGQLRPPKRILHIDDDEEDRLVLEEALKKHHPQILVHGADSGQAALGFLQESKRCHELPCLIVLDLNLPGMNGKEVLWEIKKDQQLACLPLVIFTTATEKAYKDLIEKERVELLTKPSSPVELMESVRKMLNYCYPN